MSNIRSATTHLARLSDLNLPVAAGFFGKSVLKSSRNLPLKKSSYNSGFKAA